MKIRRLVLRNLMYYWRTNTAVILGVATAVAVLCGALLVGDSVRGSLRDLVLERLGRTDQVVVSTGFFRAELAEDLKSDSGIASIGVAPMILAQGFVSVQSGGGRAGKVLVYGVDERFWSFHGISVGALENRDALLSPALAIELGANTGETILIRTQRPSDIPLESLHGRKADATRTVRATVHAILPRESLGEFSLQPQQGSVRAVFLPLALLQRELAVESRANTLLISGLSDSTLLENLVRNHFTLEDLGLKIRLLKSGTLALESASGILGDVSGDAALAVATDLNLDARPLFTYLANSMRIGDREIPYSLVTAMDFPSGPAGTSSSIVLSDWAARDLHAKPGDMLSMEYFLWEEPGQLVTRTTEFTVDRIVPINAGDPDMAPVYPGITNASTLKDWDPPFPIDLRRVRPTDEEYWREHTTTPKAFIPLEVGQRLWNSRYGALTSIRVGSRPGAAAESTMEEFARRFRERINPIAAGIAIQNVRSQGLDASRGATDFGEYFVYFSFFLVISALLLAALFFKLSVEQRIREVGLLRAVGLGPSTVRRIFLSEGLWLSLIGALLGAAGGVFYAAAIIVALRTWWIGAIGTDSVTLHLSPVSIFLGAAGGVVAALICISLTLRHLRRIPERALLSGQLESTDETGRARRASPRLAATLAILGVLLLILGATGLLNQTAAFFGSGLTLLAAALFYFRFRLSKPARVPVGVSPWSLLQLGLRNASFRPARSVVAIATIASATFILIAVDSFRKAPPEESVGGYGVLAEMLVPLAHDPNSKEGREALGLGALRSVQFEAFRVRAGDDASCLNLYEPKNPRILGTPNSLVRKGRFRFQSSLATTAEEEANPWLLLNRAEPDGAIPVIADANSMTYVLHRKLGEDFVLTNHGEPIRLRFVGALSDSIFQSELVMSQENFLKLFPEQQGYSLLLAEVPPDAVQSTIMTLEDALADYGVDATSTAARLAEFHRVENTYLSTFQMLGGLGLLLGTIGLAAVLMRSVLERRRELAMLRTLGYAPKHFLVMTLMENALLLGGGLLTGVLCAVLAIAPAAIAEGGHVPGFALLILPGLMLVSGLAISVIATRVAVREAVLSALRSE